MLHNKDIKNLSEIKRTFVDNPKKENLFSEITYSEDLFRKIINSNEEFSLKSYKAERL